MATYFIDEGDVVIEDGRIILVTFGSAIYDDGGLITGGVSYREIDYLDAVEHFEEGGKVLDLDGDYPGFWQK